MRTADDVLAEVEAAAGKDVSLCAPPDADECVLSYAVSELPALLYGFGCCQASARRRALCEFAGELFCSRAQLCTAEASRTLVLPTALETHRLHCERVVLNFCFPNRAR